jgi:hypothetical protein
VERALIILFPAPDLLATKGHKKHKKFRILKESDPIGAIARGPKPFIVFSDLVPLVPLCG